MHFKGGDRLDSRTTEKINEIKKYWNSDGECNEIDDIVSLRENAYSDVYDLVQIIKEQQEELDKWTDEFMF
jgi:cyclopropane fatty-acyl-phospholipid synthase-like methyltransferase